MCSSILDGGWRVGWSMCVYTHAHTHAECEVLRREHLLGGRTKSGLIVFFLLTYLIFRKRKVNDVNVIPRP